MSKTRSRRSSITPAALATLEQLDPYGQALAIQTIGLYANPRASLSTVSRLLTPDQREAYARAQEAAATKKSAQDAAAAQTRRLEDATRDAPTIAARIDEAEQKIVLLQAAAKSDQITDSTLGAAMNALLSDIWVELDYIRQVPESRHFRAPDERQQQQIAQAEAELNGEAAS